MPPFYFDHNVSGKTVRLLRQSGHDVVTAHDIELANARDHEHVTIAASLQRVLVSHNAKDFQLLHDAWRAWTNLWAIAEAHAGVLIIPQPPRWTYQRASAELVAFFNSNPVVANELYEWHGEQRRWERRIVARRAPKPNP